MNDDRWVSALTQTAKAASWQRLRVEGVECHRHRPRRRTRASLGPLSAVIADVEVNRSTGKIVVKHVRLCRTPGRSTDGSESQMTGGIQSVTRVSEAVMFTGAGDTLGDVPLLLQDHPAVTPILIQRPEIGRGGEPPAVPTPAAIANALDATGVRTAGCR
jgi:CO/xanthine dehydrogenase Mo-binding subunit